MKSGYIPLDMVNLLNFSLHSSYMTEDHIHLLLTSFLSSILNNISQATVSAQDSSYLFLMESGAIDLKVIRYDVFDQIW